MAAISTPVPMGLLCLVLLLAVPALGLHCNLLKWQQQRLNQQSMELLKGMKAKVPPECLRKMLEVSFPTKILRIRRPQAATKAILEMLRGFLHLFKEDHLKEEWMHKLQLKKYFRSIENFLKEKGLDRCMQEFVRHEIQVDF
ncbi:hypothetical protein E2320_017844, partial [Naja naja]